MAEQVTEACNRVKRKVKRKEHCETVRGVAQVVLHTNY